MGVEYKLIDSHSYEYGEILVDEYLYRGVIGFLDYAYINRMYNLLHRVGMIGCESISCWHCAINENRHHLGETGIIRIAISWRRI